MLINDEAAASKYGRKPTELAPRLFIQVGSGRAGCSFFCREAVALNPQVWTVSMTDADTRIGFERWHAALAS